MLDIISTISLQEGEPISIDYKVKFVDGLKPEVCIYAIDAEKMMFHDLHGSIHVTIRGVEYSINPSSLARMDVRGLNNTPLRVDSLAIIDAAEVYDIQGEDIDRYEAKTCEELEELGLNVIKVQKPEHREKALRMHETLYRLQIEEMFKKSMETFIESFNLTD